MGHCPVLTKFRFAVDPVNAAALLGSVYLSSHASGILVHCDSFRCQQGHANISQGIYYLPLQTQHYRDISGWLFTGEFN